MWRLFVFCLLFSSCGKSSLNDYKKEGVELQLQMVEELRSVRSLEDLMDKKRVLSKLHLQLVDLIEKTRLWQKKENKTQEPLLSLSSDLLRDEMLRVLRIEGTQEIMEEIQKEALYLLDHID